MGDWFGRHPIAGFGILWAAFRAAEVFIASLVTGR